MRNTNNLLILVQLLHLTLAHESSRKWVSSIRCAALTFHIGQAARLRVALLLALLAAPVTPVQALDRGDNNALITSTVAGRERLRVYDARRTYGAEKVAERDRSHVEPDGIRAGNYVILPGVSTSVGYDNNIFSTPDNAVGDMKTVVAPSVAFQSDLPRHVLNFSFGARMVDYLENSDQDYANLEAEMNGALHFDHAHTLSVRLKSELAHEEPRSQTAPLAAAEPVPVFINEIALGITRDVGKLYGTFSGSAIRRDYSDVRTFDGTWLDQDNRDADELSAQLRMGYRFSPGYEAIGQVRYVRQYGLRDRASFIDSHGYEALAGLRFETGPLLQWSILAGYGIRDYDDPGVETFTSSLFEGEVQWLATQRLTVTGVLSRSIDTLETPETGGRVATLGKLKIDYDIYNDLVFHAGVGVSNSDYISDDREDWSYSLDLGLEYFLDKNWSFTINYDHATRESSIDAFDFSRDYVGVGAKLRF